MRVAVPCLIATLAFSFVIFDGLKMVDSHSNFSFATGESMLSLKSKPKSNEPEKTLPHRGGGRRSLMTSPSDAQMTV